MEEDKSCTKEDCSQKIRKDFGRSTSTGNSSEPTSAARGSQKKKAKQREARAGDGKAYLCFLKGQESTRMEWDATRVTAEAFPIGLDRI